MKAESDPLSQELRDAVKLFVANISKSFIVEWYNIVSETNHDFLVSIEVLIEEILLKLAQLCIERLNKYRTGQIMIDLIHEHVLSDKVQDKINSIESQINDHEYDICQDFVVHLYGLLCNNQFRRLILTESLASDFADAHQANNSKGNQQNNNLNFDRFTAGLRNDTSETSALYTLVIAMLTKSVFMPIVEAISAPEWLYALIIWICDKEELADSMSQTDNNSSSDVSNSDSGQANAQASSNSNNKPNMTIPTTPSIAINSRACRSLDLEEGVDILAPNINFENPVCDSLKRPLDNIEIYSTEEVQTNNSCYVLYCIRYDGLCHRHPSAGANVILDSMDMPVIDRRRTNNSIAPTPRSPNNGAGPSRVTEISSRKSFRRSMTIKRRFREFVILQLRLEENPKIRPYMKNIPKPTKLKAATQNIFSLPGITNIKLDQSTIKLRQRFLERFLLALNNSPFIANSYEFKEFFSYNVNSATMNNISKSKSLILQVNLNKVFVESVRSAFSIIRATLPGDNYQLRTNQPDPDEWLIELQQSTLKLHVQTRTSHTKMNLEKIIDSKLISINERTSDNSSYSKKKINYFARKLLLSQQGRKDSSSSVFSNNASAGPSKFSAACNDSSRSESTDSIYYDAPSDPGAPIGDDIKANTKQLLLCKTLPVAQKIIDIVHYSITRDFDCANSKTNLIARLLAGSMVERYAINLIEAGFNLENAAFCVSALTKSIWETSDGPALDMEHASLDEAVNKLTKLLERKYANHSYIPKKFIHSLIVKQLKFYLSQLASMERNKFVIYSFFVQLMNELEESA